jgi:hypothetical protein
MARHWQSARPVETLSVMQQDMKLQLSTICMQELVDRVRSRLQAAAAALLTGDQQKPQPAANGIASGLPQHQHAAVTAVALALARLQQLDSDSADASSTAGTASRWFYTDQKRAADTSLTGCIRPYTNTHQNFTGREPVHSIVADFASCVVVLVGQVAQRSCWHRR